MTQYQVFVCVYQHSHIKCTLCVCLSIPLCVCVYQVSYVSVSIKCRMCVCLSTVVCVCVYQLSYVCVSIKCVCLSSVCLSSVVCVCVYQLSYVCVCLSARCQKCIGVSRRYGVATVSRIDNIISFFAEYRLFYRALLQKRPIILSMLLTEASP